MCQISLKMTSDRPNLQNELALRPLGKQTTGSISNEGRDDPAPQELGEAAALKMQTEKQESQVSSKYVEGIPLALICFGLVLGVMCLSLVSAIDCRNPDMTLQDQPLTHVNTVRIAPSSLRQFPRSRRSSILFMTLLGMVRPIS